MLPSETLIWQHMHDLFNCSQTPLWRFSKFWRKSQYKTSNCKCSPLKWESRIRNISHTYHIGNHCFGGLFDKHKARKFTVQILLIWNSSPPHFSEADLAILSCTPGRQEAYGLLIFTLKDSHPIKWELCDRRMGRCLEAITTNFLDMDILNSLLEICLY